MKNLVLTLMVLLIAIGVAAPMVGGTFGSFSDLEISEGNYFGTAGLDLRVAKCAGDFNDDPYVEPCFEINRGNTCELNSGSEPSYSCQLTLWNAARCEGDQCEHGAAYLHIKNVEGGLSDDLRIKVERWDCRARCWDVVKDWTKIGCLECKQIELFTLYASETQKVRIKIELPPCSTGESVEWDMAFELLGDGFTDIETSHNYLTKGCREEGCSPGFWKRHKDEWPHDYAPRDDFNATFKCDAFDRDITLRKALKLWAGDLKTLAREAVAALLNAAHPDVNYPLTVAEVMAKVWDAIENANCETTKAELESYNTLEGPLCKD